MVILLNLLRGTLTHVVQLLQAMYYKPKGRRFHFRRDHGDFSLTSFSLPHLGTRVDAASNRNEY